MPPPLPIPSSRRGISAARRLRVLVLGLIVLLHAAGLWWLRSDLRERPPPARREAARVTLRVLPLPAERRSMATQPPTRAAALAPARAGPSRRTTNEPTPPPRFDAVGAPAAPATPATPATPDMPAVSATPPRPAALDLRLPRAASAPPTPAGLARSDPRSNTAGARSFGERLGAALGSDDRIVEERLNDGRMRVRQGASCVEVHPARSAQLDPYDQAARPTPRSAKPCD